MNVVEIAGGFYVEVAEIAGDIGSASKDNLLTGLNAVTATFAEGFEVVVNGVAKNLPAGASYVGSSVFLGFDRLNKPLSEGFNWLSDAAAFLSAVYPFSRRCYYSYDLSFPDLLGLEGALKWGLRWHKFPAAVPGGESYNRYRYRTSDRLFDAVYGHVVIFRYDFLEFHLPGSITEEAQEYLNNGHHHSSWYLREALQGRRSLVRVVYGSETLLAVPLSEYEFTYLWHINSDFRADWCEYEGGNLVSVWYPVGWGGLTYFWSEPLPSDDGFPIYTLPFKDLEFSLLSIKSMIAPFQVFMVHNEPFEVVGEPFEVRL